MGVRTLQTEILNPTRPVLPDVTTQPFPETAPQTGLAENPADAFGQVNKLPWLGNLLLNAQDYQTQVPEVVQQQAQQGYGYQWMSDMFADYLGQQGRQYAKALDVTNLAAIRSGFDESGVAKMAAADIQQQYGAGAAGAYNQVWSQNEQQKMAAQQQQQAMELSNQQATQNVELLNDQYRRAIESAAAQGRAGISDWLSSWNQDVTAIQQQQQQFEWGNAQQQRLFEEQLANLNTSLANQRQLNQPQTGWEDYVGMGITIASLFA